MLYPTIAEAAHRVGARAVALIDVGCSAALNLIVDRVGVSYGNGQSLGDPSSPVRTSARIVGERALPSRSIPAVTARIGVDRDPVDVTSLEDVSTLRASLEPDRADDPQLEAALAIAQAHPPQLISGDLVDSLPEALARVPAGALPVVITAWTLSGLSREKRLRFLHRLDEAATHRPVAWVSAEGVGVAPAIPTMGDRHASGHSILGLAIFDHSTLRTEAVGRCWSQGRILSWLAA